MISFRINHVITSLGTGGAELVLLKLLSRTPPQIDPTVISLTDAGPVGRSIESLGIPVVALGLGRGKPDPRGALRLAAELRKRHPHIIQTWLYHADLLASLVRPLVSSCKLVWGIRSTVLDPGQTSLSTRMAVRACAWLSHVSPDRIICCSEVARDFHERLGYDGQKFVTIPNGFDIETFAPSVVSRASLRAELGLPLDAVIIGHVARFHPQKDHRTLIQAARAVCSTFPEAHFVLCGESINWNNRILAEWIDAALPRSRVHLLGLRMDVSRLTAGFDVAVSSSSWGEAFSNALGEAMSCGVPCVATDVGDARRMIAGTGTVVPPGSGTALADAIVRMLALPKEERIRLGEAARRRVEAEFSLDMMVRRFHAVHSEVVEARG